MRSLLICLLAALPLFSVADEGWKAGAASVVITPSQPLWMAGYASRKEPAGGTETELHAKALLLEDAAGKRAVIVTLDLVGIDRAFSQAVVAEIEARHGLPREAIALCCSHTHSGPVVAGNLRPMHLEMLPPGEREKVEAYAKELRGRIVSLVGEALAAIAPARVQAGSGKCTFAVNRRENKEAEVPDRRTKGELKGPSDHDVPVLSVRDESGRVKAVLFGYACHATVLSGQSWNADYPGYAQSGIEAAFPGAVALFWAGCGGDQNPIPRRDLPLAQAYGAELAARVGDVLRSAMAPLAPELSCVYREIPMPLAKLPTRDELRATAGSAGGTANRFEVARAKYLLKKFEEKGALDGAYPYPVAVWTLGGSIDFVLLGGEVVVDYALRLKRERGGTSTWVAGYSNDVMAYIPSLRVLKEGGYEGGLSNVYYGLPGFWDESVEEVLTKAVHEAAPHRPLP